MDQTPPKRVGIYANPEKEGAPEILNTLWQKFSEAGIVVTFEEVSAGLLPAGADVAKVPFASIGQDTDLIVVLGGDGTMLGAVRAMGDKPKPVAGINTGSLGFLTAARKDGVRAFAAAIMAGEFSLSSRTLISAKHCSATGEVLDELVGLNEAVVSRGALSRIIKLDTFVDGDFLNRFYADGLIVSTPTGSTAYSLSAGGPIVSPGADVFVVTPICPHALANRPLVVADGVEIEIRRDDRAEEVQLAVDGQEMRVIGVEEFVKITRASYELPLVSVSGRGFYEVLQQKLHWNGSSV